MQTHFSPEQFLLQRTPFYYYDMALLDATLAEIKRCIEGDAHWHVHYAVKANANPAILSHIAQAELGADCVSGGEIEAAIAAGVPASQIVYAGVGKSDWEIEIGLKHNISCFNVESVEELQVINDLATRMNVVARVAFRINPNVDAHTHEKITTGLSENKFGIDMCDMEKAIRLAESLSHVEYTGLHFHIGSQILDNEPFRQLCLRINELQKRLEKSGIHTPNINVGGGLGINYEDPDSESIPNFESYFRTFREALQLREGQQLHFELGRSIVGQCGSLISRVLYIKKGHTKQFLILDGSMTELVRPAMYGAFHKVQRISADKETAETEKENSTYDVVGPVCESSDVFVKNYTLPTCERGDLIAIRSAGAYGESMASTYNLRPLPPSLLG